jgi:hypothetical protein
MRRLERHEKKRLALDMQRDLPPSLLEALYGLEGDTQELGQLSLGFS